MANERDETASDTVLTLCALAARHGAMLVSSVDELFVASFVRGRPDARRFLAELPDPAVARVRHEGELTWVSLLAPDPADDPDDADDPGDLRKD